MAGVILPHDTFGTHLDNQGKTIDFDLERENFVAAGKVLANVFSNLKIDGHEVQARYVSDPHNLHHMADPGGKYRDRYVIETQYMTVVLFCDMKMPEDNIYICFNYKSVRNIVISVLLNSMPGSCHMNNTFQLCGRK